MYGFVFGECRSKLIHFFTNDFDVFRCQTQLLNALLNKEFVRFFLWEHCNKLSGFLE